MLFTTVVGSLLKVKDLAPLGAYSGDHNCGLNVEERIFHTRFWTKSLVKTYVLPL